MLEIDNIQNEASLRDFLNFQSWQHQKGCNLHRGAGHIPCFAGIHGDEGCSLRTLYVVRTGELGGFDSPGPMSQ